MSRRERLDVLEPSVDLGRREALKALAGGGLALGGGKAIDNVLVGYGVVVGTNLVDQDLEPLVAQRFGPSAYATRIADHEIRLHNDVIQVIGPDNRQVATLPIARTTPSDAAALDSDLALHGGPLEQLTTDLGVVAAGDVSFEFSEYPAFFDRLDRAESRQFTVGALRGHRFKDVDPDLVARFADGSPADPEPLIEGLARGFREYSGYDVPRYVAGSIQDNVIFDAVDLRKRFQSPTDLRAIVQGENSGLFCYEFAYRSVEALHAVSPRRQTVPVLGAIVTDARHKHVYTGVASAIREDGELVIPMTFVDYTHSTLYDDFKLRGVLGEGINAYDERHRTDGVYWNRYARW